MQKLTHTLGYEEVDVVEQGKKKVYACIFLVVVAAVVIGMIYCWGDIDKMSIENEGTLVFLEGPNIWN